MHSFRSSRPEVFCQKGVLRNFAKFIGKHLCQSLIGVELSIKYLGIKPRLDGGSSALKFLLHVRKGVIFFFKNVFPSPPLWFSLQFISFQFKKSNFRDFSAQNLLRKHAKKQHFSQIQAVSMQPKWQLIKQNQGYFWIQHHQIS